MARLGFNFLQMLKKGTKLYSILTGTCPRCQSDKMYTHKNPFSPGNNLRMHEHCRRCGLRYSLEPSFFFGAMYISYGIGVALSVGVFIVAKLSGADMLEAFFWIFGILMLSLPVITRVSRTIWINLFVSYDPGAEQRFQSGKQTSEGE